MHPLDNPVWHALIGPHAKVAEARGGARRYSRDYAVFTAVPDDATPADWDDLRAITPADGVEVMFHAPGRPDSWTELGTFPVVQMTWTRPDLAPAAPTGAEAAVDLGADDHARLTDLVRRTEPGPWRARTAELGSFIGIVQDGRLVAAAGQRLRLPDAVEISAVCTDPEFRGRGYAGALVAEMARRIRSSDRTPFLHVSSDNPTAQRVYDRVGFTVRTVLQAGAYRPAR